MLRPIGSSIIGGTKLLFRLAWLAPNLLYQRKKALRNFQKQLYGCGIEKDVIKGLTVQYKEMVNFKQFLGLVLNKK